MPIASRKKPSSKPHRPPRKGFGRNPLERKIMVYDNQLGRNAPITPDTRTRKMVLSRLAQREAAIEQGMSFEEANAYVQTLRMRPNRRRGLPNVEMVKPVPKQKSPLSHRTKKMAARKKNR